MASRARAEVGEPGFGEGQWDSGYVLGDKTEDVGCFFNTYLFWLCPLLITAPGPSISTCGIFYCSVLASLWLWGAGSGLAAHRLTFSTACGILIPQPRMEPMSSTLEGGFLPTGPPGKSQDDLKGWV